MHGSSCSAKNQMKCSVFEIFLETSNFNSNFFKKKKRVRVSTISMGVFFLKINLFIYFNKKIYNNFWVGLQK